MNRPIVRVEVIDRERNHPRRAFEIQVDSKFWMEAFRQLPRAREILPHEAEVARIQEMKRKDIAHMVAHQLAQKIAEAVLEIAKSGDTIMGYEPEQWAEMHTRTDHGPR